MVKTPACAEILLETTEDRKIFVILLSRGSILSVLVLKSSTLAPNIQTTPFSNSFFSFRRVTSIHPTAQAPIQYDALGDLLSSSTVKLEELPYPPDELQVS